MTKKAGREIDEKVKGRGAGGSVYYADSRDVNVPAAATVPEPIMKDRQGIKQGGHNRARGKKWTEVAIGRRTPPPEEKYDHRSGTDVSQYIN